MDGLYVIAFYGAVIAGTVGFWMGVAWAGIKCFKQIDKWMGV
jgi:hypothetical protein